MNVNMSIFKLYFSGVLIALSQIVSMGAPKNAGTHYLTELTEAGRVLLKDTTY